MDTRAVVAGSVVEGVLLFGLFGSDVPLTAFPVPFVLGGLVGGSLCRYTYRETMDGAAVGAGGFGLFFLLESAALWAAASGTEAALNAILAFFSFNSLLWIPAMPLMIGLGGLGGWIAGKAKRVREADSEP